ncbi:hypothetical protein HMJ29_17975 [Hymenobacter taeanensis]|uniref:Uncharacterized protein n=1 Tax=Hymenobacter taeanensis TaxID=2735321 RepID=A0A6M6BLJ0_9BACT|nr:MULTISPECIES: hypothetical protein [Hymenobacter]QJX48704.1 hypothetical protein HMJ29_17975 [Hymenobacter taeanensis]UOQ81796.1 hypothetical protein MUN83_03115 [Hymenobacter sp. 5414T-23]
MNISKSTFLLTVLLFMASSGHAQSPPGRAPAAPAQQQLTVQVTLPTAVAVMSDYARALFSSHPDKLKTLTSGRKTRTSNPTVEFTIDLPKGWGSKKGEKGAEKN